LRLSNSGFEYVHQIDNLFRLFVTRGNDFLAFSLGFDELLELIVIDVFVLGGVEVIVLCG